MSIKDDQFYVSYSELVNFSECAYRHNLLYTERLAQEDTIHTVFGSAVHNAIDRKLRKECEHPWISMGKEFLKQVKEKNLYEDRWSGKINVKKWLKSAFEIYHEVFTWIENSFPGYELIGSEIKLFDNIEEGNDEIKIKGFVDLLLKWKNKYYLIDFKTCDWGWSREKLSDTKKKYQLRIYKHFVAKKYSIPEKEIETSFLLLKRNPGKSERFQQINVSSGDIAQKNAVEWLNKNTGAIKRGVKIKNRSSCFFCPFYNGLAKNCE